MAEVACTHRWVIGEDVVGAPSANQRRLHPGCIWRPATCRLCDKEKVMPELIGGQARQWVDL